MTRRQSRHLGPFRWLLVLLLASCGASSASDGGQDGKTDDPNDHDGRPDNCPSYAQAIVTGKLQGSDANEISGLVMSRRNPGLLWAHNDGDGNRLKLYAIDRNGELRRELKIRDLDLVDLEDIAIGPGPDPNRDYLYLADTGDNPDNRKEVSIIRLPEPNIEVEEDIIRAEVTVFRFRYDDHDPHDAEAMFVDPLSGEIYVITKNGGLENRTRVYKSDLPKDLDPVGRNELHEVLRDTEAPDLEGSVVAADISADGQRVAFLYRKEATRTWLLEPGESIVDALRRPACLSPRAAGQQEALAFSVDSAGYYMVPEGNDPKVYFVAERAHCAEFAAPSDLGEVRGESLQKVTGVVVSRRDSNLLWAINDANDGDKRNQLSALTSDGLHLRDLELVGIVNKDWEDLAVGPGPILGESYLYVADIGDKDLKRGKITVHRFVEPHVDEAIVGHIDSLDFEYPGDVPHDAESLLVDPITGDLYVITRNRSGDDKTRVYRALAPFDASAKTSLHKVLDDGDNADLSDIVAADTSPDGLTIALARRDGSPLLYSRSPEGPAFEAFKYRACRSRSAPGKQDSIALVPGGDGFFQLGEGASPHLFHSVQTSPRL